MSVFTKQDVEAVKSLYKDNNIRDTLSVTTSKKKLLEVPIAIYTSIIHSL